MFSGSRRSRAAPSRRLIQSELQEFVASAKVGQRKRSFGASGGGGRRGGRHLGAQNKSKTCSLYSLLIYYYLPFCVCVSFLLLVKQDTQSCRR